MSKKNKKGAWRKKHEEAVRLEKLRTQELKKKKRKKKVVVKGKNLKRMGIIPKDQRLLKSKRSRSDDMVVVEDGQARPSKRRKVVEEDISTDDAKDTAKKDLAETSADWIAKELQYDWSKKKKFQVGS